MVTTDASGKTTAQFKATKAGAGLLRAEHDYTSIVKHKPQKAFGSKGVVINDPPSGVWMVTIDATERMESIERKNDQFSFQIDRKNESKNISVAALVRPTTSSDGTVTFSSGDNGQRVVRQYRGPVHVRGPQRDQIRLQKQYRCDKHRGPIQRENLRIISRSTLA